MTLCEKLIDLRRKAGLSQEQMAQQLDVSRQAVSKWETGESLPDTNKLLAIAVCWASRWTICWTMNRRTLLPPPPGRGKAVLPASGVHTASSPDT